MFLLSLVISIGTLTNSFLSRTQPTALFVLYIIIPPLIAALYTLSQLILIRSLGEKWAILDVLVALLFFFLSQLFHFALSAGICQIAEHYIDGMFFGNIFMLLAVMMVYKYWDSITQEDLEFAIGGKQHSWEVSDPLLRDDKMKDVSGR